MQFTFQPFGDRALLLQWEHRIDRAINAEVVQWSRRIESATIPGVQYCLPAYCSLTVGFRPEKVSYETLCGMIRELAGKSKPATADDQQARQMTIPVCYAEEFAPDLPWISQHTGLAAEQIIQLHTTTPFRVYMLGFLPGFPYLGILPKILETPRKETPRLRVPPGAVALAGRQTGIYPVESPGGWQIIGRSPWKIFDPAREQPFLLQAGDEVYFESIDEATFRALQH